MSLCMYTQLLLYIWSLHGHSQEESLQPLNTSTILRQYHAVIHFSNVPCSKQEAEAMLPKRLSASFCCLNLCKWLLLQSSSMTFHGTCPGTAAVKDAGWNWISEHTLKRTVANGLRLQKCSPSALHRVRLPKRPECNHRPVTTPKSLLHRSLVLSPSIRHRGRPERTWARSAARRLRRRLRSSARRPSRAADAGREQLRPGAPERARRAARPREAGPGEISCRTARRSPVWGRWDRGSGYSCSEASTRDSRPQTEVPAPLSSSTSYACFGTKSSPGERW